MALESATWISDLNEDNPAAADPKSQGDDHIRLIKHTLLSTFPDVNGVVTASDEELSFCNGVTSNIQAQLNTLDTEKADLASPALTGTPTAPTASTGTSGTQIATLDFVIAASTAASLPGQTGKDDYIMATDGTDADWSNTINTSVVTPVVGTAFATTTGTQTLTNKTITDPNFADSSDTTKQFTLNLVDVGTATQRVAIIPNEDMTLFTPYARLLSTVTASNSATVDIEHAFDSTYDLYLIEVYNIVSQTNAQSLQMRFKKGGSYLTTTVYAQRNGSDVVATGQTSITIDPNISNAGTHTMYVRCVIPQPFQTGRTSLVTFTGGNTNGNTRVSSMGSCTTTGAIQGVRFLMSSGNISTGTFKLFGIRKT